MTLTISQKIYYKIARIATYPFLSMQRKKLGIQFFEPNYLLFDSLNESSVVIDVGCGHVAEFSRHLIEKYHLTAYGVDPTKKHSSHLEKLEKETKGRFKYLPCAVTERNGTMTFFESVQNESGSILKEHNNIQRYAVNEYKVESVNLQTLASKTGSSSIDLLKLDLEGAEYDLLKAATKSDIEPFQQLFIEFHHHCTDYDVQQTKSVIQHLGSLGLKHFSLDFRNYLLYR